jgi:hypothetical protein
MTVKVKRICHHCSHEFIASLRALYCSGRCRQAAYRNRLTERNVTE